jgi:hypothetical protein
LIRSISFIAYLTSSTLFGLQLTKGDEKVDFEKRVEEEAKESAVEFTELKEDILCVRNMI